MSEITRAYCCGNCDTWHDSQKDAEECCEPYITDGWKCGQCGQYHESATDAENCCPDDCSALTRPATPAEKAANLTLPF